MHHYYGQDSSDVEKSIEAIFPLRLGDTRFIKSGNKSVFDFVGFVIKEDAVLTVFPKHYVSEQTIMDANSGLLELNEDSRLLFLAINKYINETNSKAKADKYIGEMAEFESDYPFHAFFDVYDYYKRYGIYYEEENTIMAGRRGKISWRHTMQHSNVVVSNENIIYLPLYSKRKNSKATFISECMVFVINYTLHCFPYFLQLKPANSQKVSMDFIANRGYVLKQLYQAKNHVFKDIHKKLVDSLICFFEELDTQKHGGSVHVKINYFNIIWQTMVNKYLNDCFVGIDTTDNKILFDESIVRSSVSFRPRTYIIDASSHQFEVELDHYGFCENEQYIFDSKYYGNVTELNYKQFVYNAIMDNYANQGRRIITHSALLLPGLKSAKLHLDLLTPFGKLNNNNHQIIEHYLNVKTVMKHYVEN
ncbi:MAG: hypothetical protein HFI20_10795 [Lachnospiraceae bacterium]|nr:hypothetical protein [Lachnospiraceae bacterium]